MTSISEGLSVAGEPGAADLGVNSEAGFNAALAAKVSAAQEPTAAPVEQRSAPVSPDTDEALAIKRSILGDEGSTSIESGLVTKDNERERIRADYEDSLRRVGIDPDEPVVTRPSPELKELAELRADAAETSFWESIFEEGYERAAEFFAELRGKISPERAEEVAYEIFGIDADTPEDDNRWHELDALEREADAYAAQARFQASLAMKQAMETMVSENTVRDTKTMVNEWKREEGISADEARARISRAESELGVDLLEFAQQFGVAKTSDVLRSLDSALVGEDAAIREYRFKERMLAEPSTSISEGLEQLGPMGYVPVVPRPPLAPRLDEDRAVRRAVQGRTTAADIKRGVTSESALSEDFRRVQKIAGEMAEAQRPKPRTPAGF